MTDLQSETTIKKLEIRGIYIYSSTQIYSCPRAFIRKNTAYIYEIQITWGSLILFQGLWQLWSYCYLVSLCSLYYGIRERNKKRKSMILMRNTGWLRNKMNSTRYLLSSKSQKSNYLGRHWMPPEMKMKFQWLDWLKSNLYTVKSKL